MVTTSTRVAALVGALAPDGEPDGAADGLAEQVGQPARGRTCRDPARLGDHDAPGDGRGDRGRDQRRLARAGRRLHDDDAAGPERGDDVGEPVAHGQVGRVGEQPRDRVVVHARSLRGQADDRSLADSTGSSTAPTRKHTAPTNVPRFTSARLASSPVDRT